METNYQKLLEQFRSHYKEKFGVQMDDDILYLIIRINELHKDLKKDIKSVPELRFKSGWDYFLYGLGKFYWICLALFVTILIVSFYLFNNK